MQVVGPSQDQFEQSNGVLEVLVTSSGFGQERSCDGVFFVVQVGVLEIDGRELGELELVQVVRHV